MVWKFCKKCIFEWCINLKQQFMRTIEQILEGTEFEKYIKTLKVNGLINLPEIIVIKNNGKLSEVLKKCIENEDDIIKLYELFEKEKGNKPLVKIILGLPLLILLTILIFFLLLIFN